MSGTRLVSVLGSTGSIGTQTLDVIERLPERFAVYALSASTDVDTIASQIERHKPKRVAMVSATAAAQLRDRFPDVDVLDGPAGLSELASDQSTDVVLNAVVGAAGLEATLNALDAHVMVALANKESCVAGGPLVRKRLLEDGQLLVPVDSEHAAAFMCLQGEDTSRVVELVLTASGGPFRGKTRADLAAVDVKAALKHPTWAMGPKITIDSATLANKGLEVLEAHVLFGTPFDQIDVVCHPQSVIHCLIGFADGSWKSSMSPPDMRVPIAYALGYPQRSDWGSERVDWKSMAPLSFEPVDTDAFRMLPLAYNAGRTGGTAPAVLNAANEVAVEAFLEGDVAFLRIDDIVGRTLDEGDQADIGFGSSDVTLEDVLTADAWARERAKVLVSE